MPMPGKIFPRCPVRRLASRLQVHGGFTGLTLRRSRFDWNRVRGWETGVGHASSGSRNGTLAQCKTLPLRIRLPSHHAHSTRGIPNGPNICQVLVNHLKVLCCICNCRCKEFFGSCSVARC